jgi:hypothetical protein
MTSPYTQQPLDALMAAQLSVGITLTALLWARPMRFFGTLFLFAAIVLAVSFPVEADVLRSIGVHLEPDHATRVLHATIVLAVLGAFAVQNLWLAAWGLAGGAALWQLTGFLTESNAELAAANLAFCGFLIGVHWYLSDPPSSAPTTAPATAEPPLSFLVDDLTVFALATALAAIISTWILGRYTNSGDEWAPTYQAALFAKLRIYGELPPCPEAFRSFWVFHYMGRVFEQYPPGWAYFMTPFVIVRAPWLAGPFWRRGSLDCPGAPQRGSRRARRRRRSVRSARQGSSVRSP